MGFTVDTAPTLLAGLGWPAGVLLIALLASRRTPLPRGWDALHRVVRPAVSSLVAVLLVAVAAGFAAAGYAAIGDDHPGGSPGPRCWERRTVCGWGCRPGCSSRGTPRGTGRSWGPCPIPWRSAAEGDGGAGHPGCAGRAGRAGVAAGGGRGDGDAAGGRGDGGADAGGGEYAGGGWFRGAVCGAAERRRGGDTAGAGVAHRGVRGRLAVRAGVRRLRRGAGPARAPRRSGAARRGVGRGGGRGGGSAGVGVRGGGDAGGGTGTGCRRLADVGALGALPAGDAVPPAPPGDQSVPTAAGGADGTGLPEDAVPGRGTPAGSARSPAPGNGADDVAAAPTVISPTPPPRPPRPDRRRLWPDKVPPPPRLLLPRPAPRVYASPSDETRTAGSRAGGTGRGTAGGR